MLESMNLDLSDSNLKDTPSRIARMYCNEFFKNVSTEFKDFRSFPNTYGYNQIIVSDRIQFTIMCAHHFLPFSGLAWISYVPKPLLIGGSKMARLVNHYSHRPQIQENLCHEILSAFNNAIQPEGVMVFMKAVHGCMKCRGVKQSSSGMMTSAVSGIFAEDASMESKGLEMIKISLSIGDAI